jgi:hypothetical protein
LIVSGINMASSPSSRSIRNKRSSDPHFDRATLTNIPAGGEGGHVLAARRRSHRSHHGSMLALFSLRYPVRTYASCSRRRTSTLRRIYGGELHIQKDR